MSKHFRMAADNTTGNEDHGVLRWVCHPASTGANQLTVIDATLAHGQGHSFHSHPNQEEVLFVIAGKVEQWVEQEKRILNVGDAAFIPAGMVHASFNAGEGNVRLLAILGPSVGDGLEMIDRSSEAPWKTLRA
jgi:quercetin dioxygenase-like cupin family protein